MRARASHLRALLSRVLAPGLAPPPGRAMPQVPQRLSSSLATTERGIFSHPSGFVPAADHWAGCVSIRSGVPGARSLLFRRRLDCGAGRVEASRGGGGGDDDGRGWRRRWAFREI